MSECRPSFLEALGFWARLGCVSFGGPAAQIALMHSELVERRRWISEERFQHALSYSMLLPGPEAQQLATYAGWQLYGIRGGLAAGGLFVLPAALLIWALSWLYMRGEEVPAVRAIFDGLMPAAVALVSVAAYRMGAKVLQTPAKAPLRWIVLLGTLAMVAFSPIRVPFPVLILIAGVLGFFTTRRCMGTPCAKAEHGDNKRSLLLLFGGVLLWAAPVGVAALTLGGGNVLTQTGVFFSKVAMVTFGGAYAALPYVVESGYVDGSTMLHGLALAETTPGPLLIVLQFAGFVKGWKEAGFASPLLGGTLGAAMTSWCIFFPSFLWIFAGAPHVERLRSQPRLAGALALITCAVLGFMVHLAIRMAGSTFITAGHFSWPALLVAVVAAFLLWKKYTGPLAIIIAAAALAWLRWALP